MDWTHEEQAILEEGLCKYSSETSIVRYAKIAVLLKNKTVRDVALRCRWMTKKDICKRRKEDFNARKIKDRKEKVIESFAKPSRLGIQPGLSHAPGMVSNFNDDIISYNDVNGATHQLLQQNAWAFKQISTNLATHQMHENICLLSQARDNIFKILSNLNEMGPTMKRMPPLPQVFKISGIVFTFEGTKNHIRLGEIFALRHFHGEVDALVPEISIKFSLSHRTYTTFYAPLLMKSERNSYWSLTQKTPTNRVPYFICYTSEVLAENDQKYENGTTSAKYSEKADVYNFEMICFKLLMGKVPSEDAHLQGEKTRPSRRPPNQSC
ncbi:Protein of unknown function (DUF3755 [Striga hermonthica]|uniref:Myb-like domain-containing protein n=1 Tax=Striga hermonthica TaxID=68872 RepID=A0A9N7RJG1_STRHE|nr:Protein of unknown function (DUF3755 [Striga hermonthica]